MTIRRQWTPPAHQAFRPTTARSKLLPRVHQPQHTRIVLVQVAQSHAGGGGFAVGGVLLERAVFLGAVAAGQDHAVAVIGKGADAVVQRRAIGMLAHLGLVTGSVVGEGGGGGFVVGVAAGTPDGGFEVAVPIVVGVGEGLGVGGNDGVVGTRVRITSRITGDGVGVTGRPASSVVSVVVDSGGFG